MPFAQRSPFSVFFLSLEKLLSQSFDEAIAPQTVVQPDGSVIEEAPDKKQAYLNLLRVSSHVFFLSCLYFLFQACELNGVALPKGSFALAKMLDAMTSQQEVCVTPFVIPHSLCKADVLVLGLHAPYCDGGQHREISSSPHHVARKTHHPPLMRGGTSVVWFVFACFSMLVGVP